MSTDIPWRERTVRADIGLGVENHDDGRTIVEMGIEVPPFIAAPFRADALTVFKLRYFDGSDAKSLVIGGTICQPKAAILAVMHGYVSCGDRAVRYVDGIGATYG